MNEMTIGLENVRFKGFIGCYEAEKILGNQYEVNVLLKINVTDELNTDDSLADGIEAYVLWKAWTKEKEPELALAQAAIYASFIREGRRFVKKQTGDRRIGLDIDSPTPMSNMQMFGSSVFRG